MSNSMKLILRTLLIVLLMAGGSWLSGQLAVYTAASGNLKLLTAVAMYAVYFIIGTALSGMVNPRLTKGSSQYIYLFPIVIFVIIGTSQLLYWLVPLLPFSGLASYLSPFAYLSWTLAGVFTGLAFR